MRKNPPKPDDFPFRSLHETRFRDMDALGHVNNSVFLTYLEEARIRFIRTLPEFVAAMDRGQSFVLARVELDLLRPIHWPARLLIGSGAEHFGNSSIVGMQAIFDADGTTCHAVARTTGVWFDLKANRPARLPDLRDRERWMVQTPPPSLAPGRGSIPTADGASGDEPERVDP